VTNIAKVKNQGNLSFHNNYSFMKKINDLPMGPKWKCELVKATENICGENGEKVTEELDLWFRNPVEIIRDLIGNPAFKEHMAYAPEKAYQDKDGKVRIFDETWTGDWWWETQVKQRGLSKTHTNVILGQATKWGNNHANNSCI
jgi:hypothetical protein